MMKRILLGLIIGGFVAATTVAPRGQGRSMIVGATLSGANEVPPTQTGTVGKIQCTVTDATIRCRVDTWNAQTSRVGGHIHVSPAGVNGPIVCDSRPNPARISGDNGFDFECNAGNITLRPAQGIGSFADFVESVSSCGTYFNEHTELFPGGDVRGQLVPLSDNPFTGVNSCSGIGNK
jgi:hypothetical protein